MKENTKFSHLPELLSPAGSPEALDAAIKGGADAVYMGGKIGNARMEAKNFENDALIKSINYAHDKGKKIFITLNTLFTDREITAFKKSESENALLSFAETLINAEADAFIVQDIGLASLIKKYFPEAELHASTQAAGHNTEAAFFLRSLGFSRMVAARELSEADLKKLIADSPIETEMFIHGALCSSHSGRCSVSMVMGGGRSANRGSCAQPCRLSYNGGYPLSLKDLCLAPLFEKIIALNPKSLKIEGRMKSASYVYGVTKIYRALLDAGRSATKKEIAELENIFSRSGFTDGYFTAKKDFSMYGVRTKQNIEASKKANNENSDFKLPTETGNVTHKNEYKKFPSDLTLPKEDSKSSGKLKLRLVFQKLSTLKSVQDFFTPENLLKIEKIFLPLNEFSSSFYNLRKELLDSKKIGIIAPYAIFDGEKEKITEKFLDTVKKYNITDALMDNIGQFELLRKLNLNIHADSGMNVTNSFSADYLKKSGANSIILSPELNFPQIRDIIKNFPQSTGIYIYGRIPVMIMENCLIRNAGLCRIDRSKERTNCPKYELKGAKGESYPVIPIDSHRNMVLNSNPVYLADRKKELKQLNLTLGVLNFTTETAEQTKKILNDYCNSDVIPQSPKNFTRLYK